MGTVKIRVSEVLRDLQAGISKDKLKEKYGLSDDGVEKLFEALVKRGDATDSDIIRWKAFLSPAVEDHHRDTLTIEDSGPQHQLKTGRNDVPPQKAAVPEFVPLLPGMNRTRTIILTATGIILMFVTVLFSSSYFPSRGFIGNLQQMEMVLLQGTLVEPPPSWQSVWNNVTQRFEQKWQRTESHWEGRVAIPTRYLLIISFVITVAGVVNMLASGKAIRNPPTDLLPRGRSRSSETKDKVKLIIVLVLLVAVLVGMLYVFALDGQQHLSSAPALSPSSVTVTLSTQKPSQASSLARHESSPTPDPSMAYRLLYAAYDGRFFEVERALTRGADPNTRGPERATALMAAALRGHVDIVRILLDAGTDINARDAEGWTALTYAIRHQRPEVVELLRLRGGIE